jgi:predicted KAP-like P-loop ATPase
MKMRFLPDKPIETWMQDQLNLRDFVSQIRTAIENTETPFVFGVLGDWGTGKTSTLNLLKDNLITNKGTKPYFVPIWFNAWLYENEANIVYPLLYAIKKDYEERRRGFESVK